jgi:pimeloyl-ACP methyl ester carboxylesterase
MAATAQDEQKRTGRTKVHAVRGGGGLLLHVRERGKADGPPILFIHGWSQNHLCWARQYQSAQFRERKARDGAARAARLITELV